jgi:LPS export ABC transporter protein LptC
MKPAGAIPAFLLLCLAGCSLDYEEAMVQETMAESVPDVVLRNMQHSIVRDGNIVARLEATRAVQYEKRNETLLEGIHFREMDDQGELLTEIWADEAVWHTDTEDAEATGDIYVYSFKEKAEVFAKTLAWKKQDRVLSAGEAEEVVLRRDDGSELRGTGFSADFRRSEIKVKNASGVYVRKDEEKDGGTDEDKAGGEAGDAKSAP